MKAALSVGLIVGFLFATEALAIKYEIVNIRKLGKILTNPENMEKMDGRSIQITGLIHGSASESVSLDLRPDANKYVGTDNESPTSEECVGLVVPQEIFRRLKGNHVRTILGKAFLFERPGGFIGAARYQGITFHPNCGFFNPKSLYILVEHIQL